MTIMGTMAELRVAVGSLGSLMEVWEIMKAENEDAEDIAAVEQNIRSALGVGDEVRRQLLKRGNINPEESSTVLSFVRMKRDTLARLEEGR